VETSWDSRTERGTWDGVTLRSDQQEWVLAQRDQLADAAQAGDWPTVLDLLGGHGDWVNTGRVGGRSWYTPLHQAGWHPAPIPVVDRLVALGAWRTLRNAEGQRAVDIAVGRGHRRVIEALAPVIHHPVPTARLILFQEHLHELIRARAGGLITDQRLRLPELEPLTELKNPVGWFAVPGMYGGFNYRLEGADLVVESWSRVVEGSGQRHTIGASGPRLTAEGFV